MHDTETQLKSYLNAILLPLVPRGIELACDNTSEGISVAIIPKAQKDYRILLGTRGEHSIALRRLVKVWAYQHCPHVNIHVFVPNSKMIK